jgi:hypothetical protein
MQDEGMESGMNASGAFEELIGALTRRWRAISDRFNNPAHNTAAPCDLNSLIRAIQSHPSFEPRRAEGRPRRDITLRQLLDEFALFRAAIFEEVSRELSRPLEPREIVQLNGALDDLTAAAVEQSVAQHYSGIEQAIDGQNAFMRRLSHEVRGQLNDILVNLQLLEREIAGTPQAHKSVADLKHLRHTILATMKKLDEPAISSANKPAQPILAVK